MIPKKFHFVFGFSPDFGGKDFNFMHYMAIKSAILLNEPEAVYFYYKYEPQTEYFKKIKPYINLVQINLPEQVYGLPLKHFAHKSDIVRLLVLKLYGGIYLDLDTICVKPFDQLLDNKCVVGMEERANEEGYDLCNAVIMAERNSLYIQKWIEMYQTFRSTGRDMFWGEHSVRLSRHLADRYSDSIYQAPYDFFHYPISTTSGLKSMFAEEAVFGNAYCHHLWESKAWDYIENLDESAVKSNSSTYNGYARRHIDAEIDTNLSILVDEELEKMATEVNNSLKELEETTDISYLFKNYYYEDRDKLIEYGDMKYIYDKYLALRNSILLKPIFSLRKYLKKKG